MTAIPGKSTISGWLNPSDHSGSGSIRHGGKALHVIDGDIYALGRVGTDTIAMWKSTDDGVSWVGGTYVASQTIVAGAGNIRNASLIPNGTDIYVVVHQVSSPNAATSMYTFDTTNDTFAVGAGTLPQTLQTVTSGGDDASVSAEANCCGIMVGSNLVVWTADVTTLVGRIQYGDPTVDTTWTVPTPPAPANNFRPGAMILNVAGTKVHCFAWGRIAEDIACTYEPGVGFSTSIDYTAPRVEYDVWATNTVNVAYVGNTGGVDYFVITGHNTGSLGFGAEPYYRRMQEDGSGDLSATLGSIVDLDGTNAQVLHRPVLAAADPVTAGKSYIFWGDSLPSPETYISKTSTNYGSTYTDQTILWDSTEASRRVDHGVVFTRGGGGVVGFISGNEYSEFLMLVVEATIQPTSDIVSDRWESAPTASQSLFSQVDEVTPSDTDYIYVDL